MLSTRARSFAFYIFCSVVLVVMMTKAHTHVLPGRLAHEFGDESEAFPIAILFCAFVQYLRTPLLATGARRWLVVGLLAVGCWVFAWLLLHLGLPSSVATLNESFVAVGAMILYATIGRPVPHAWAITAALAVAALLLSPVDLVRGQAESVIPIALTPMAFDWADRTILHRDAIDLPRRRALWCVALVVVPLLTRFHLDVGGHTDVLQFGRRATEGFLALLIIHLFFSYWLGPRWRNRTEADVSSRNGAIPAQTTR